MNNIIRFWNQNRKGIITIVVAFVLLIIVIQVLNQMAKNANDKKDTNTQISEEDRKLPTQSIIGGDSISTQTTKENVAIIEEFIEKCNSGDVTGAYQMLTQDCKEALFSTEENFKKGYIDIIFKTKRIGSIEHFLSKNQRYTYKVKFYKDMLATGDIENTDSYQDYITIDENSNTGMLNINNFIYKKEINKEREVAGIKVIVLAQEIYKDSEKYQIKIENRTDKRVLIDTRERSKSVYLVGDNNVTYNSYLSELSSILYEIPANFYRNYEIRFNKIYSAGVQTTGIVFSDMVADCEAYNEAPEKVTQRVQISVSL